LDISALAKKTDLHKILALGTPSAITCSKLATYIVSIISAPYPSSTGECSCAHLMARG